MKLHCNICGQAVSTVLPDESIVRAWIECPKCSAAFPKVEAAKMAAEAPTVFTARALFGENGERSVTESDYENLIHRIMDFLRKQRNRLPIVILVK